MNLRGGQPGRKEFSGSRQCGGANGQIQIDRDESSTFLPTLYEKNRALRLTAMARWILVFLVFQSVLFAQPKRVLYITHSAGFRHDCLPVSQQVMTQVAARTGRLEVHGDRRSAQL